VKVLFFINHDGAIRNFEAFLHSLAERGHDVHLSTMARRVALMSEAQSLEDFCATSPRFSFDATPKEKGELSKMLAALSSARSYLRYLGPEYENSPKLSGRAQRYVHPAILRFIEKPGLRSRPGRWALDRMMLATLDDLPTSAKMDAYIESQAPDVALFTPLVTFRNHVQLSALRSAESAGVPTALLVHSWDNLTNKGLIPVTPDRVAVWNDQQKDEAVRLHRVPEKQVVVTGAHSYDHWFDAKPSTTREEFCARAGLDPSKPFVLYVCSSTFIAPHEVPFVRQWISLVRESSDPRVREIGVLVRPHPQNTSQWEGMGPDELDGGVVYPPISGEWAGSRSREDYFDSIYHCSAVMGINTTALIESSIQGRPVLTWLVPEYRDTQEGTLHFEYIGGDDGLMLTATSFEEHEQQLAGALASNDAERSRKFVEHFIRPAGVTVPSTAILVDAVDDLVGAGPVRQGPKIGRTLAAPLNWTFRKTIFSLARRQSIQDEFVEPDAPQEPRADRPKKEKGERREKLRAK
jgi:hypothetical protein